MNSRNIKNHLRKKIDDWVASIDDVNIQNIIKDNVIVTGGALVSLLNSEEPHDYDMYFKTKESCMAVAEYYAKEFNEANPDQPQVKILDGERIWSHEKNDYETTQNGRITCFIKSAGATEENEDDDYDMDDELMPWEQDDNADIVAYTPQESESMIKEQKKAEGNKRPYRPKFFSTNAISLSDKVQLVIRFYGAIDEIHENYDFVHCSCSYDYKKNEVNLPARALESIINKELIYVGSKYPVCSVIRTRKFISRGWHISAGEYVKMSFQISELNLKNFHVFKDQLTGVDSLFFETAIRKLEALHKKDPNYSIDKTYLFQLLNEIFGNK